MAKNHVSTIRQLDCYFAARKYSLSSAPSDVHDGAGLVEANIWGMLFYAQSWRKKRNWSRAVSTGIFQPISRDICSFSSRMRESDLALVMRGRS